MLLFVITQTTSIIFLQACQMGFLLKSACWLKNKEHLVGVLLFLVPPRRIERQFFGLSYEPPAKEPHFNLSFWLKDSNKNLDVKNTIKNLVLTFNLKNSNQIAVIFVTIVELKKITNQPVCASWLEFPMVKKKHPLFGCFFWYHHGESNSGPQRERLVS